MPIEDDLGALIVCRTTIGGSSTDTDDRTANVTPRERLHKLVDELSDQEADAALRYIVQRREEPVIAAFRDAPEDDERFTSADEDALAEVQADRTAGVPRISYVGTPTIAPGPAQAIVSTYAEIMRKHGGS